MSTATFKTAIKYKGQYYKANMPLPISNNDAAEFEAMGAIVELTDEQVREVMGQGVQTTDERNNCTFPVNTSVPINSYLEMSVSKLKTSIETMTDIALLESLIRQDTRTSAKSVYCNRIEELEAAE